MTADWNPDALPAQSGKTIVVTGGNAGIGYFVSEQLAATGARIVLASRSEQKADAAAASIRARVPGANLDFVRLDLSSLAAIRDAAAALKSSGRSTCSSITPVRRPVRARARSPRTASSSRSAPTPSGPSR